MGHGLVYSTEQGRMCPACGKPIAGCTCRKRTELPRGDGMVRVSRETRGRKGKGVTVISGIPLDEKALKEVARELKAKCGAGGSIKDGVIEIQGDHRDTLMQALRERGWTVKRVGG